MLKQVAQMLTLIVSPVLGGCSTTAGPKSAALDAATEQDSATQQDSDTQQDAATLQIDSALTAAEGGASVTGSISIPNVVAGTNFSFDISVVDSASHRYYLADRNNKGIDVIDTTTDTFVKTIAGFTGCTDAAGAPSPNCSAVSNPRSGPNGVVLVGTSFIYVGDVNAVKVIDRTSDTVVKTITISTIDTENVRTDEGCFDPDHNLVMIATPEAPTPFATFIDTTTHAIVAKVMFHDSSGMPAVGLEQCAYDHASQSFFVNNDGTTANPHGELDVIPAASLAGLSPDLPVDFTAVSGVKTYPEGNCDPTGLALGPGNDLAVGCRPAAAGSAMNVLIMDRTSGAVMASVHGGGGDELTYDVTTNRYLVAASRWTTSGMSNAGAACTATAQCTPVLNIIDAASRTLQARIPTGNGAHSVGADGLLHKAYVPYSSAALPVGAVTGNDFSGGGISVIALP